MPPSANTEYQKYLEGLMQICFECKWDRIYNEGMILRELTVMYCQRYSEVNGSNASEDIT